MVLKKPVTAAALSCKCTLPRAFTPLPPPPPPPTCLRRCLRRCAASPTCSSSSSDPSTHVRRWYANKPSHGPDDCPPWPASTHPTPYEIFAIQPSDAYTKKRFYQLVKLYHPDINAPLATSLPRAVRLERYRLIVAANDVLSDPAKRHAYDVHGIGWHSSARASLRDVDRAWRHQPGSAAANATWEDWERWYEARDGKPPKQDPMYMPNSVFAVLVAMTCVVGALLQGQRAENAGAHYLEAKAQQHQAVGDEVRRSTQASAGLSQDERVGRFLRDRENVAFQFIPSRYDEEGQTDTGDQQR